MNRYLEQFFSPEKAAQLEKKYLLDLAQKISILFELLEENNTREIRKIAHQLKGSGTSYGFEYVSAAGEKLSAFAKEEDFSGMKDCARNLDHYAQTQIKPYL